MAFAENPFVTSTESQQQRGSYAIIKTFYFIRDGKISNSS